MEMLLPTMTSLASRAYEDSRATYELPDLKECLILQLHEFELKHELELKHEREQLRRQWERAREQKEFLEEFFGKVRNCGRQVRRHTPLQPRRRRNTRSLNESSAEDLQSRCNNNHSDNGNDVLIEQPRITTVLEQSTTEIQSQPQPQPQPQLQPQPRLQPQSQPHPQLQSQPRQQPQPQPQQESQPTVNSNSVSVYESDTLLEWNRQLKLPTEPQPGLELDWPESSDRFSSESSDSENEGFTKSARFEKRQFKQYYLKRGRRWLKKSIFTCRKSPYIKISEKRKSIDFLSNNRSVLRTQHNVDIVPLCANSWCDCHHMPDPQKEYRKTLLELQKTVVECGKKFANGLSDKEDNDETDAMENVSFRHDPIDVPETLSRYVSVSSPSTSSSSNEDTNQRITRKRHEELQQQIANNIKRNTLNDHCYHQVNEPTTSVKSDELELSQTEESDEEEDEDDEDEQEQEEDEEIDVVSIKKVSFARQITRRNHLPSKCDTSNRAKIITIEDDDTPVFRRPRGRPPGSTKRKVNASPSGRFPKRARVSDYEPGPSTSHQESLARQYVPRRELSEDMERRQLHNNMERQRRINMKQLYEQLRRNVPATSNNDRASKVSILKQATMFVTSLAEVNSSLEAEVIRHRQKTILLKNRIEELRSHIGKPSFV